MRYKLWITVAAMAVVFTAASTGGNGPSSTAAQAGELGAIVLAQGDADAGSSVFQDTCSRCHEPDGSGLPGEVPPLRSNPNATDAEYVEEVVRNGLTGPIEVLGVPYDDSMRGFADLSDGDVADVVAFVVSIASIDPTASTEAEEVVEPGDVDEGHALFIGRDRFDNGGAACAGCHTAGKVGNLGGWSLGPDLTGTFETFGGEAPLAAWLEDPASATMAPLFVDHPLTANEIADVAVFLGDAPSQSEPADPGDGLILAGLAGLIVLIGGMAIAWRGMRQTYAERLRSKA